MRLSNLFCKEPESKYLRLWEPCDPFCSSLPPLESESSHTQHVSEQRFQYSFDYKRLLVRSDLQAVVCHPPASNDRPKSLNFQSPMGF